MTVRNALQNSGWIVGVVIALVFGAIQTSFFPWVDTLLYALAAVLALVALGFFGYALWRIVRDHFKPTQRESTKPGPKRALFSMRIPEYPRRGHIDSYKTVWFDKVLVTKRSEGDRVLRFDLSMPGRKFVDVGEFQEIYQDYPSIHSKYHSNPLDLPNNSQKVLAFVIAEGSDEAVNMFELSIRDIHSDQSFIITSLGEHICFDDGSVELDVDSPVSPDPERERTRAWQDLEIELAAIMRSEGAAYRALDSGMQGRGVSRSGLRTSGLLEIAEEHDRQREGAVLSWTRRLEDIGVADIGEPPSSGAIRPSIFRDGDDCFDRRWSGRDPLFCGSCGRLAYVANTGGGEALWCPEHEYEVS